MSNTIADLHSKIANHEMIDDEELNRLVQATAVQNQTVQALLAQIDKALLGKELLLPPFWPEKNRAIVTLLGQIYQAKVPCIRQVSRTELDINKCLGQTLQQFVEQVDDEVLKNLGIAIEEMKEKVVIRLSEHFKLQDNISHMIKQNIADAPYYNRLVICSQLSLGLLTAILLASFAMTVSAFTLTGTLPMISFAILIGSMLTIGMLLPTYGILQATKDEHEKDLQSSWCKILFKVYHETTTFGSLFESRTVTSQTEKISPISIMGARHCYFKQNRSDHREPIVCFESSTKKQQKQKTTKQRVRANDDDLPQHINNHQFQGSKVAAGKEQLDENPVTINSDEYDDQIAVTAGVHNFFF